MPRILVAEDDQLNREVIVSYLQIEGYKTVEARDGMAALRAARNAIDLVILDLGLPAIDGLNVIRTLRREKNPLPIIVLSARVDEVDRVISFEAGADDYVCKPFLPREVVCRVRAVLRRAGSDQLRSSLKRFGAIEIDEAAREVRVDGKLVGLRPQEFALVCALAAQPGVAMSRRALIDRAWGSDYAGDERTIDGHVRRIRQKFELHPDSREAITTIYGFGYKFSAS
jgi:DNA-binding response OmpR family regulator